MSASSQPEPDARDPRRRILDAAVALIGESGWAHVTTRMVTERAGVNNALLHYYFGSKRALFERAAHDALERAFAHIVHTLLGGTDLAEGTRAVLHWVHASGPDDHDIRTVTEITIHAMRDPVLHGTVAAELASTRQAVAERALEGGASPERAEGLATVVLALLDGMLLHRAIDPELDVRGAADALMPLFAEEAS